MPQQRKRKRIRYAVIGLGHIAQVAVLPAFKNAARNSVLTALISDDQTKLKKLGRKYRAEYVVSYEHAEDLFRTGEVDALYIKLPNDLHAEWTIKAQRRESRHHAGDPAITPAAQAARLAEL